LRQTNDPFKEFEDLREVTALSDCVRDDVAPRP
jgi:hypothetical protein